MSKKLKFSTEILHCVPSGQFDVNFNPITVSGLGMQRAGKFPGILETFHGKFWEFWRGGNFWKFWEFSNLTYFQNFTRLLVQKSTELNSFFPDSNTQVLLYFLAVSWCVWVYRKNHKASLWVKIRPNLLSLYKTKYLMPYHIIFRISTETPGWKRIFRPTVNLILSVPNKKYKVYF